MSIRPATLGSRPILSAADAAFRDDFLRIVANTGFNCRDATQLVEISTGCPFDACTPAELVPALRELLALVQRTKCVKTGSACKL